MAETVESYLLGYHARFPGITSRTFARGRIDDFRSSYDALCDVACATLSTEPSAPKPLLLDLGCGDGYLLERLVRRGLDPAQLVGIDMSPDELTLARARPALDGATLRCERAQTMSLASASVSCVVSHLAFIHMVNPEDVVAEIARVLCPGGVFSTLLIGQSRSLAPDAFALFLDHFTRIEDSVGCDLPDLVDHRLCSFGGWAGLFHQRTGFGELAIDNLEVSLDGSVEEVWHSLSGIYEGAVWSADEVEALRMRFFAGVESLRRADGTVPCRLAFQQLTCRRLPQPV
jgi:SAM-dependent methyltransferase